MTIAEVNLLDRDEFVQTIGWVFEHSPWVAERAWAQKPFHNLDALHAAMVKQVRSAERNEQLDLLRAHPDLGTRARIGAASAGEQARAGLDCLMPDEFEQLHELNIAYREKFGFPFLFAVKGSTKYDILSVLEQRLQSPADEEYEEALRQVFRIARFRLEGAVT
jgi:2-oxo-4-hydroxy-4-carboxy-5-ureidoimidazoline decarboxylase